LVFDGTELDSGRQNHPSSRILGLKLGSWDPKERIPENVELEQLANNEEGQKGFSDGRI
jgi:hypothetical protein